MTFFPALALFSVFASGYIPPLPERMLYVFAGWLDCSFMLRVGRLVGLAGFGRRVFWFFVTGFGV